MRIEAKETIKHHPYYLDEGDIKNVPDEVGQMMVANGWAKNSETGEDNEPSRDPVTLDIDNSVTGIKSEVK